MNIMSRIRGWFQVEAEKLRPMSLQQKISYLTTYYTKWVVLYLIIALFVGFGADALIQSRKEIVLQGFFTNDDNNYFPGSRMEKEYASLLDLGSRWRARPTRRCPAAALRPGWIVRCRIFCRSWFDAGQIRKK